MRSARNATVLLIWIGLAALVMDCAPADGMKVPQGSQSAGKDAAEPEWELTNIVKSIVTQGGWAGKEATVVGYYRGWDLLKEANQAPPVTRSDWVIKDQGGAIYVQAKDVPIQGEDKLGGGRGLKPMDKESTNHIVKVTGIVRLTGAKQPYIEPASIELLK
jgi:hypothetical protein